MAAHHAGARHRQRPRGAPGRDTGRPDADVDATTVIVVGPCDEATATQVSVWIRNLAAAGTRRLIVDVSTARQCDGRLLTVLARTRADLAGAGGSLDIHGAALPQFLAALQDASLDEVFIVYNALRGQPRTTTRAEAHSRETPVGRGERSTEVAVAHGPSG